MDPYVIITPDGQTIILVAYLPDDDEPLDLLVVPF
jgi:hypothetical protein